MKHIKLFEMFTQRETNFPYQSRKDMPDYEVESKFPILWKYKYDYMEIDTPDSLEGYESYLVSAFIKELEIAKGSFLLEHENIDDYFNRDKSRPSDSRITPKMDFKILASDSKLTPFTTQVRFIAPDNKIVAESYFLDQYTFNKYFSR